jgi:hypothetical protein
MRVQNRLTPSLWQTSLKPFRRKKKCRWQLQPKTVPTEEEMPLATPASAVSSRQPATVGSSALCQQLLKMRPIWLRATLKSMEQYEAYLLDGRTFDAPEEPHVALDRSTGRVFPDQAPYEQLFIDAVKNEYEEWKRRDPNFILSTVPIFQRSQSKIIENWRNFLKNRKQILETPGMIPQEYIYLANSRGRSYPFQDLCIADQMQIERAEYEIEMEEAMHPSVTPVATKRAGNKRQPNSSNKLQKTG